MEYNRKPRRRRLSLFVFLTALACCGLAGDAEAQTSDTFGVGEQIPTFPRELPLCRGPLSTRTFDSAVESRR